MKRQYDAAIFGMFGQLGTEGCGVHYLQSLASVSFLPSLTLVADLPGSEQWPIRQLFQRDINSGRVEAEIIPYLLETDRVKFFNPLTLAVLPMRDGLRVDKSINERRLEAGGDPDNIDQWGGFEAEGIYRVRIEPAGDNAQLEWNSRAVRLVAIDGQHRLSALKRLWDTLQRDPEDAELKAVDFANWRIPLIFVISAYEPKRGHDLSLLDKVRDIFVTINKEAKRPTRCRTILLNDYSISSMCCQEMLDGCHANGGRDIPLPFFDWRASSDQEATEHDAAFLRIEELEDLHLKYLIGGKDRQAELDDNQKELLSVAQMRPPLDESDKTKMRTQIRERYVEKLMPAVLSLLVDFRPFGDYIKDLRILATPKRSDVSKHAVSQFVFGKHHGADQIRKEVDAAESELRAASLKAKAAIPQPFAQLVGVRGFFCGYGIYRRIYWAKVAKKSWSSLAGSYVKALNAALGKKLFAPKKMKHVVWDAEGKTVHYRHDAVPRAFGAYCALIALSSDAQIKRKARDDIEHLLGGIEATIRKGVRREIKPIIVDKHPRMSATKLTEVLDKEAQRRTRSAMRTVRRDLHLTQKGHSALDIDDEDDS